MRTGAARWLGAVGIGLWWFAMQLGSRVEDGSIHQTSTVLTQAIVAIVFAALVTAANVIGERRAGGYGSLALADSAAVDEAVRTGVPSGEARLRHVERERARRLASPGPVGTVVQLGLLAAIGVWTVWSWGPWPTWLKGCGPAALLFFAASIALDLRRDRTGARALLAATD